MVSSEMSQKMAKEGPRLSKNQKFSEHFSIHCCPPFTFLNSKREIVDRKYSICKSGCFYQKKEEDWICCACQKTSQTWDSSDSSTRMGSHVQGAALQREEDSEEEGRDGSEGCAQQEEAGQILSQDTLRVPAS
ncbi:hypothetical protein NN561_016919 [Cricetulus griseus]